MVRFRPKADIVKDCDFGVDRATPITMRIHSLFGLVALLLWSANANAADELCEKIKLFEKAPFSTPDNPSDWRWVEFHWGFEPESIWSWGCRHSNDQIAKTTCLWLKDNTNQEFR